MENRRTFTNRQVSAICDTRGKRWTTPNAQGIAARHTDSTGHDTNVEVFLTITYKSGGGK